MEQSSLDLVLAEMELVSAQNHVEDLETLLSLETDDERYLQLYEQVEQAHRDADEAAGRYSWLRAILDA